MMSSNISHRSRVRKGGASMRRDSGGVLDNKEAVLRLQYMQYLIDRYNQLEIYVIDPWFKGFKVGGHGIVIRNFRENVVKYIDDSNPEDIKVDAYYRQIDARESVTEKPRWVHTPLPYIERGVIVAIGDELRLEMAKKAAEAKVMGLEYNPVSVGDVVDIKADLSVWYRDHRFYINKQGKAMDYVRNQQDTHLNNFEGYFICDWYEVEGYMRDSRAYYGDESKPNWVTMMEDKFEDELKKFETIVSTSESEVNKADDGGYDRGEGVGFGLGTDMDIDN